MNSARPGTCAAGARHVYNDECRVRLGSSSRLVFQCSGSGCAGPDCLPAPHGHDLIARVGIYDPDGAVQCRIGEEVLPGNFITPHGLRADSRDDLHVGEVTVSSGAADRLAPFTPRCFRKFKRSG